MRSSVVVYYNNDFKNLLNIDQFIVLNQCLSLSGAFSFFYLLFFQILEQKTKVNSMIWKPYIWAALFKSSQKGKKAQWNNSCHLVRFQ